MAQADEVAEMIAWLCSDRSSFSTDSYYPVDGCYAAQ
jgi:NAD(P)-dependent dehydrogenase (short-subunit alcohol dehydrogenase family)